ncbi:hypothetical protein P152DRAFT_51600 [Eremomyces bilateralis CBS 781.70]|uniref:Zn(2)-C6 fungal-type domain-containing protein n=1 Tax=Eremomyces bilateralis CBS 781.70 TaxID=1392243 RepID=A0A6G1G1I7_9PEZI|nr:uncharacterized protein P152DRAFT_51600 [Eremomyces bilateralis CBS 781.70]KAF1811791.1 hypothetical protein P152DRAFT_51600 [Eremomyces bilateralis CBS 781.70]
MSSPSRPIACTACSRAKTKCDKLIPTCSRCKARRMVCEPRTAGPHNASSHSSRSSSNPLDASMQRQMTSFYQNQGAEPVAGRTLSSQSRHYGNAASNPTWPSSAHPLEACRMPSYYDSTASEGPYLDMDMDLDSGLDLDCNDDFARSFSSPSPQGQMTGYLPATGYTTTTSANGYNINSHCGPGDAYAGYVQTGTDAGSGYGTSNGASGYANASPAFEHSKSNSYPYMQTKGSYQ